jgi:RNAse (barnase) inhibitor barstar
MTIKYIFRIIFFLLFVMFSFTCIVEAGDGSISKASEKWRNDVRRLVVLSRLVANKPSLLRERPSTKQVRELSAEPFGCESPDLSECLLSKISIVLLQQSAGSANIFDATQGAAVQIDFMRATDVWTEKDIENRWDVAKKWTDAVGPAALILGALLIYQNSGSNAGAALIGSGAGLILVGNLGMLGQMYGGVTNRHRAQVAKKTINTLQDIEASRQVYENSQLMYGFLKSYSNKSNKLLSTLLTLSSDAKDLMRAAPSPDRARRIVELCDNAREVLSSFKETAGFTDDYANQLLDLYIKHQEDVSLPLDKKKYEDAQQSLKEFNDNYFEIIVPFLEGVPEEMEAMQNIKAAIIANSIADKQYF